MKDRPTNERIADALEELANRLAERDANPHRVQAYQTAAQSVRFAKEPLVHMVEADGVDALKSLPGVGDSIASRIAGFIETGHLVLLEQIKDEFVPERLFTRVGGIGKELARRIYDELGIETLEELEMAAHDGRLEQVEGFGAGRVRTLRDQLTTMLSRQSRRRVRRYRQGLEVPVQTEQPPVGLLLNVDLEYRYRAARGELHTITPRRFNPSGEAWLPLLNTRRGGWRVTALFSNTARAHELEKTDDWVVLYAVFEDGTEQQYTVVTETRGDLADRRVVRGREAECRAYYETTQVATAA